jgi:hypothetical protein
MSAFEFLFSKVVAIALTANLIFITYCLLR